ncbi:recombinase family protein [Methylobacterium sp. V23]|uniref:recombinase family protein n=1 Tax=Methylobacterium sp. V23 TaxID=2044878 RepID=UPI0011B06715|nr:recombinase family protein [Methylobacterium sp. V23]
MTKAKRRSADFLPIIRDIQASGITSAHAIAQELNARGIRAARGGFWQSTQIQRVLAKVT